MKSTILEADEDSSSEEDSDLSEEEITESKLEVPDVGSFDPKNYTELESYEENKEPKKYDFYTRPD